MNFLLHRHRKLSEVLRVPEGLRELMSDITREVLRFQPRDMEAFIADYLESMLLTRELYQIASQTVEDAVDSSFQIVELLQKDGISEEQAESAVDVIKEEFRSHLAEMDEDEPLKELNIINRLIKECKFTIEQAHKASEVIESAWTHYYQRNKNQVSKISPDFTNHAAVKNTLTVYEKSKNVTDSELKKSAKILDIGFQGYFKRKFQLDVEQGNVAKENCFANWRTSNFQIRERAAIKIQSWFRARKIRNNFNEMVKAAKLIQASFKGYKTRQNLKRRTIKFALSEDSERQHEAAKKIQSYYRAYHLRKEFNLQQKAAAVIQAHFRGFMTRKNRQEMNY